MKKNDQIEIAENEEITTYEKGKNLEDAFAVFMKRELKWEKVRVGAHMKGKDNSKGSAIDVIGERLDSRGKKLRTVAIIYLLIGAGLLTLSIIWAIEGWGNGGTGFLIFSLIWLFSSLLAIYYSIDLNKENAWVECKNLKGKVNINQVEKSLREFMDYKNSGDKEYKFKHHYFVSASGYIENALKFAVDKGLICYQNGIATF